MGGMGTFNTVRFNQATFNQQGQSTQVASHFYLFDLQSSNRLLLDTNAATDNEYLYRAFGEKVLSTETIRNPFQFQGEVGPYNDALTRIKMGARIVNPLTGRWLSPDPIRFEGGDWNLYRFVRNNPIYYVDPSGNGVTVQIIARSVTVGPVTLSNGKKIGPFETPGDHTYILIWDTDDKGKIIPGQTPYIIAGYNINPKIGNPDGHLHVRAGYFDSSFEDYAYYGSQQWNTPTYNQGTVWSMTDHCKTANQVIKRLRDVAHKINVLNPNYNFLGITAPNSNSTIGTVIRQGLGLDVYSINLNVHKLIPGFDRDILNRKLFRKTPGVLY